MVTGLVRGIGRRNPLVARDADGLGKAQVGLGAAYRLSGAIAVLMVIASAGT